MPGKRSIRAKLGGFVAVSVMTAFVLCGFFSSLYFYGVLRGQAVQAEAKKLEQTARQLRYIQEEVEGLAKAIAVDERLQSSILKDYKGDVFDILASGMNIADMLASHLNMKPYFYSANIISAAGAIYSSNRTQGDFDLTEETWYTAFKARGVGAGFTEAHSIYVSQRSMTVDVISYVMSFRDLASGQRVVGDIVVNVDFAQLVSNAQVDRSLLSGYALYGGQGSVILQEGHLAADDGSARGAAGISETQDATRIVNTGMLDGWTLVSEVSSRLLLEKLQFVWIFFTVMYVAVMGVLIIFLTRAIHAITRPIHQLALLAAQMGSGDFSVRAEIDTGDELSELGNRFNVMAEELERHIRQVVEYEKTTREMELSRLMLQINPHFIYNTLNSIVYMAQARDNQDIVTFAKAFISLLQDTLNVERGGFYTTLSQELRNVRNYLLLQTYRYPGRFTAAYRVEPGTEDCRVPGVLLQPLVENALFHGLLAKAEPGNITITARREEEQLILAVADDGAGMDAGTVARLMHGEQGLSGQMHTIGVANVQKRVEHAYGAGYIIRIKSAPGEGTSIIINLPFQPVEGENNAQEGMCQLNVGETQAEEKSVKNERANKD